MKMYLALIVLGFVLLANPTYGKDDRVEPIPGNHYVVELRVWIDKSLFKRYDGHYLPAGSNVKKAIETDIRVVIHEINQSYLKTLNTSGIFLQVRRAKEITWDVKNFGFTTRGMLPVMLKKFTDYITTDGKSPEQYDLNVLFTGSKFSHSGVVNKGSICSPPDNAAIVHFRGNQQTAKELSRMIVESITPKKQRCPNDKNYVDGTHPAFSSPTRFEFSPCMIKEAKIGLMTLEERSAHDGINCLSKQHTSVAKPKDSILDLEYVGVFTPWSICKRSSLDSSAKGTYCKGLSNMYTDQICQSLWCSTERGCREGITLEGMVCGRLKRCYKGKCLFKPEFRNG